MNFSSTFPIRGGLNVLLRNLLTNEYMIVSLLTISILSNNKNSFSGIIKHKLPLFTKMSIIKNTQRIKCLIIIREFMYYSAVPNIFLVFCGKYF